jgi:hypothetical protein
MLRPRDSKVHFVTPRLHAENLRPYETQFHDYDQRFSSSTGSHRVFFASWNGPCAKGGAGATQSGSGMRTPTPETFQTRLEDMLDRLKPTHVQREHAEHIMAAEALQLRMAR